MHKDYKKLDWKDITNSNANQTHNHSGQSLIFLGLNHYICQLGYC
jgi:hypothetical protein